MNDRCWTVLRRWAVAALLPVLAACGAANVEEGLLPEGPPEGEVVALDYDAAGNRLLEAYPHALQQSADGGATWQPVPLPASAQEGRIVSVAISDSSGVLYLAGPGVGVLRSEDAGRTWAALNEELPSQEVVAFATHADQPRTLYAFVPEEGIHRSEDAGETWTRMDGGPDGPIRQFFHSDMEGSMQSGWLFAATPEGVRRSMDCFCGWRPTGELPQGAEVLALAYDPEQPEQVYASTTAGLFRSTDGGESWKAVSTDGPELTTLTFDRSGALYATTREGALLRSVDQGQSWERVGA
ncbi:MAG: YCF48-related protein [Longimicrobiaceae bacterium]